MPQRRDHAGLSGSPDAIAAAALGVAFAALSVWSWRRWPDLLVDFGQQLYIPWRLAVGERLHREIALLHGPLSQYLNALWFALFGPSFTVLIVANLSVLGLLTWIVYRMVRSLSGPLTATIACLVLLCVFGFAQYIETGNYNFIAPYTHESTHGMVLTAGMVLALGRAVTGGSVRMWGLAGLCLGLALLTKIDVALAALVTAILGLLYAALLRVGRRAHWLWFAGGALTPAVGFYLYFLTYLPAGLALRAVGGGAAALSTTVARNPFYLRVAGLDDPGGNLWRMIVMTGILAGFGLLALVADIVARNLGRNRVAIARAAGVVLCAGLTLKPDLLPWRELPRALPFTTAAVVAILLLWVWQARGDAEGRQAAVPALLAAVFALALCAKATLNLHTYHYGFYLALPATLVLVVAVIEGIPRWLRFRHGGGDMFRALAIALVVAGTIQHLRWSGEIYRMKNYTVGRNGDAIVTWSPTFSTTGPAVNQALRWLQSQTLPEETLVGFPEGIMLNYLARRPTRTFSMNFMMTEMILFGEERLLTALQADPPDYVLLVHKDTSEFGAGPFGTDPNYGRLIMQWVERQYRPAALFGSEPLRDERFGIRILKHSPS